MISRKEVRFLDQGRTTSRAFRSSPKMTPPPPPPRLQNQAKEKNPNVMNSAASKLYEKKVVVPPPPPPPRRKRTPTPPPTRPSSATVSEDVKRSIPPPPPPPTEFYRSDGGLKQKDDLQRTPAKSKPNKQVHYLSPCGTADEDLQNNVFLAAPALTIVSPMSGITNMTDLHSPSTSTHRKRSTNALDTTLNSIDMLNFDYIEKCASIPTLQRIIRLLSESKNNSPNLLKEAMARLAGLQQQDVISKLTQNPSIFSPSAPSIKNPSSNDTRKNPVSPVQCDDFAHGATNLSRITTLNTTLDSIDAGKSSLNFSLSPSSTLQGVELVETPKIRELDFFKGLREGIDRRLGPIVESPVGRNLHTESPKHASRSPYTSVTSNGSQQIKKLSKSLNDATTEKMKLMDEIRKVTRENEENKKSLDKTRESLYKKDEETKAIEARLEAKITELSQVLADTAARSKLVVEGERTYRKQCEEELIKENKKNEELNKELQETRDNLEKLQKRHSSFRIELLKVTGFSKTERRGISQRQFLVSLAEKIETMKSDNERMAVTLNQAKRAIQERDMMEVELSDAMEAKQRLTLENQRLGAKIQELRAEVKSSRAYIDKLLRTSNDTREEDWEKHEQQYKQVIQNLRKQIRKQDAVVSIDLYKAEKDKVREKASKLEAAEITIGALNAKVSKLESKNMLQPETKDSPRVVRDRPQLEANIQTPKNERKVSSTPTSKFKTQFGTDKNDSNKKKDDLTGITITFSTSPQSNVGSREKMRSPKSGELYQRRLGEKNNNREGRRTDKSSVLREITVNGSANNSQNNGVGIGKKTYHATEFFDSYLNPIVGKENTVAENPKTPKTNSRGSPMRMVRDLGGRSALKSKIKRMRSPKLTKSPVMPRQVQVILH